MISSKKLPFISLYINDFFCNENLRMCSASSVGVFIFLMCVLHNSHEYGKLKLEACSPQADKGDKNLLYSQFSKKLSKQLPFTQYVIKRSLLELDHHGIICFDADGTLSQPRMVRDNALRQTRKNAADKRWKNDGETADFAYAKTDANTNANAYANPNANSMQNTEDENEYEYNNIDSIEKGVQGERKRKENFSPPKVEEVRAYIREKGYSFDAESFFDFYESKGWFIGKNKMRDWRAAVRNWNRGENERCLSKSRSKNTSKNANDEWT